MYIYLYNINFYVKHKYQHCTVVTTIASPAKTITNMSSPDNTEASIGKAGSIGRLHTPHTTLLHKKLHVTPSRRRPVGCVTATHSSVLLVPMLSILPAVIRTSESDVSAGKPTSRPSTKLALTDNNRREFLEGCVQNVMFT